MQRRGLGAGARKRLGETVPEPYNELGSVFGTAACQAAGAWQLCQEPVGPTGTAPQPRARGGRRANDNPRKEAPSRHRPRPVGPPAGRTQVTCSAIGRRVDRPPVKKNHYVRFRTMAFNDMLPAPPSLV